MMARYERQTHATAPSGQRVVVSTIGLPIVRESMVFPVDDEGEVSSLMHLAVRKHRPDEDLHHAHEAVVAGVQSGEIALLAPDREPSHEEIEAAKGDLWLLAKMPIDEEQTNA
jgi:hypothetical protein